MNNNEAALADIQIRLQNDKLRSEIEKLDMEVKQVKKQELRAWIMSFSIIIGIISSIIGAGNTLSSISAKNRQMELQARVQTTNIFMDKILPQIKGADAGSKESVKYGAYITAASLANEFPKLEPAVRAVLQKNAENGDNNANEALKLLK